MYFVPCTSPPNSDSLKKKGGAYHSRHAYQQIMTLTPSINHSNQGFMNFPMEQPITGHFSGPQKRKRPL